MVDIYRASVKRANDYCTIEELRHPSEEDDQTAPVPQVEAERNVILEKVLVSFCVLLLVAIIFLCVYHFRILNHKEQDLEKLRNRNYILTSNNSDLLKVHTTLKSQYARNYSDLQSLYTTLKEINDEFSNVKDFYCNVTNTTHENTCPVCKPGWVDFKSKCYFFSIGSELNWTDSRDWCKKMNGQLVNIESSDELNFLKYQSGATTGRETLYWIDRYDISKENPTTRMDVEPVKSKRASDDYKNCLKFDFGFKKVSINNCEGSSRWSCESPVFPLHI